MLATILSILHFITTSENLEFIGQLTSNYTPNLLLALAVLVSFKQFGGNPIECLTPDTFSGSWEQYAENYCWAQDTYFVPPQNAVENVTSTERLARRISYYQWVPFYLLFFAGCLRIPAILWNLLSNYSGIKLGQILKLSSDPNNVKPEIRRQNMGNASTHLRGSLLFHRRIANKDIDHPYKFLGFLNWPYSGKFVTIVFIATKCISIIIVIAILMLTNYLLQTDSSTYFGFNTVYNIFIGKEWDSTGFFPRVALCDFQVREMGNIQNHTIQCVLSINIFNEKIFLFLWFWQILLLLFLIPSLVYWLAVSIVHGLRKDFVIRHMEMCDNFNSTDRKTRKKVNQFINYLGSDGILVMRMVAHNTGIIFGTEFMQSLWNSFNDGCNKKSDPD